MKYEHYRVIKIGKHGEITRYRSGRAEYMYYARFWDGACWREDEGYDWQTAKRFALTGREN